MQPTGVNKLAFTMYLTSHSANKRASSNSLAWTGLYMSKRLTAGDVSLQAEVTDSNRNKKGMTDVDRCLAQVHLVHMLQSQFTKQQLHLQGWLYTNGRQKQHSIDR